MPNISKPEKLTIRELKQELEKRGVTLPHPQAKKIEYVNLYKREFNLKREAGFSSDDEPTIRITRSKNTPHHEVRVHLKKLDIDQDDMTVDEIEITALSDADLRSELQRNGINAGPIVASTRRVYEKRLEKLLSGAGDSLISNGGEKYSDEESSAEEEEEEPVVMETRKSTRTTTLQYSANRDGSATRRRPMRSQHLERREEGYQEDTVRTEPVPTPSNGEKTKTLKSDRRWIPVWVQILIVILLAVFFYLVVQSMESNPQKKITGL